MFETFEQVKFMPWLVSQSSVSLKVCVVFVVPVSQPLPRLRRLTTKAGDNWQEWADVRPEQVFALSLGAAMLFWQLSGGEWCNVK